MKDRKRKKQVHLSKKITVPMIIIAILQIFIFVAILMLSGEFSYLRKFSLDSVTEKAENRKNYVESVFNQTALVTNDSVREVEEIISSVLNRMNRAPRSILNDRGMDKEVLMETAGSLVELIRKASVNDAFIILNSNGMLDDGDKKLRTGLYIRDMDVNDSHRTDNDDLLLEFGSSEISRSLDLSLDYEWSVYVDISDEKMFDFYYDAIQNGAGNDYKSSGAHGKWTGMSRISKSAQPSIKYTVPLVADDGTVYGIMGVGMLEKTIQSAIPSNDFMNDSCCYIIAVDDDNDGTYRQIIHSGPAYGRLVKDDENISRGNSLQDGMYDFADSTKRQCVCSVQDMNLYKSDSPYKNEQWSLIAVADKNKALEMNITLLRVFVISLGISLILSIAISIVISRILNFPVRKMVETMEKSSNANRQVHFSSSGIIEIDELAGAITNLQESILSSAASVSKIISMTGAGIGVFMYDINAGTVFVGESLIRMVNADAVQEGDSTIPVSDFWNMMSLIGCERKLKRSIVFSDNSSNAEVSDTVTISYENEKNGEIRWIQFNMCRKTSSVMGIAQDITKSVLEKSRIEYERDYDMTTGLLNRRAFYHKYSELFMNQEKLGMAACFMLDLDNLKYVNDTYGHDFGDNYIKAAADALRSIDTDNIISARLSGDEFILFCYGLDSLESVYKLRDCLRDVLSTCYCTLSDGSHYRVRASGGLSVYPRDAVDADLLVKYADFAMYTVKHSTKGTIGEFDINTYRNDAFLVNGVEELNRIIDEYAVKYAMQSIVSTHTGEIYGYELLMRPQSEILRSPLEFMRMAKNDSRLNAVEDLTWKLGVRSFCEQIEKGNIKPDAKFFLNTIPNNILDDESIVQLEKDYGDVLGNIVLELLESEQTNDELISRKKELLAKWKGMLALDDFGTGYNSEYALLSLKPDLIKIDRSLISGCDKDKVRLNMVKDIVRMAKRNHVLVLAEGVETSGETAAVIRAGVDFIQGYYFSRPVFEPTDIPAEKKQEILELSRNSKKGSRSEPGQK